MLAAPNSSSTVEASPSSCQPAKTRKGSVLGACVLLVIALCIAYANHFQNSFHFDDAHTIQNNAAIRELRNIPLFFRDATTFSSLPTNQSYRPLVSTLLALDYYLGGGLHPLWFHASAFLLFLALCLLLAFMIKRLLDPDLSSTQSAIVAFAAAACYGLHPANADTVNYIIASAEIISTLGVIGSFALYLAFPRLRTFYVYLLPAAIAVLAKPPAAIFPVLLGIFCVCFPEQAMDGYRGRQKLFTWCKDVLPSFALSGGALLFVQHMTPRTWVAGASNGTRYLMTQPYVTWLYAKTFFWPTGLSGDYDLAPLESIHDARFWSGVAFVSLLLAGSIGAMCRKETRLVGFGLLWFLVALLPTALFPLAEVMNDHRSFFPYIGFVIAAAGIASLLCRERIYYSRETKVAAAVALTLFLSLNTYGTWERNKIWKSEESFWHDVTIKGPGNARGLMNYGTTLMARGDFPNALDYFHRAAVLEPNYPVLLINLAIVEAATKQPSLGEQHFREALRLAPAIPDSYTYYARWLLSQNRVGEARNLLDRALKLGPADVMAHELVGQAERQTSPATETADSYLALSLQYYSEGLYGDSIKACRAALSLRPEYAEAWNNIGAAYNKLGQFDEGAKACQESLRLKPDFQLARNNLEYARQMLAK
jgi:protein O-mannosyl-transferase